VPEAHLLLATKLNAPPARGHLVARGRLTALLAQGNPLTLISAPPGFGKTTLLSEWIAGQDRAAVAWLSLDADDNDPLRLGAIHEGTRS
jgi:LuxR family maltose regulon positive regulatory protein